MNNVLQDLRYALRMMRKAPGFAMVAIVTLALGIGVNTAVFSIVKSLTFAFPPVPEPSRLVRLWTNNRNLGAQTQMSVPDYLDVRQQSSSFSGMAVWTGASWVLGGARETARVSGARVSADFFRVLQVEPKAGRNFTATEDQAGSAPVCILSHGLWQRAFNGDAGAIGRAITLDDDTCTVIGIMPADFWYQSSNVELWTPLLPPASGWNRAQRGYSAFGRLRPGVKFAQVQTELELIAARLEREHPDSNTGWRFTPVTLWDEQMKRVGMGITMFFLPAVLVLLIACANVGNMMLARAAVRRGEVATRAALGASRGRLIRQLLTECALLSLLGTVAGMALGYFGLRVFISMMPGEEASAAAARMHFDIWVFLFAVAAAVATTALFGLWPALSASRLDLNTALKADGMAPGKRRASDRLVAVEVMLALIFLVVTALAVRGMQRIERAVSQPGFDGRDVIGLRVEPRPARSPGNDELVAYYRDLQERLAAVPGVQVVGGASFVPLVSGSPKSTGAIALQPAAAEARPYAVASSVLPGYFEALRIPVLRGRAITAQDGRGTMPVVCVSQAFARRYWPGRVPVGNQVKLGEKGTWLTVVGVVGDVLDNPISTTRQPYLYLPLAQSPVRSTTLVVRVPNASPAVISGIKSAVWAFDRDQALNRVMTLEQVLREQFRGPWMVISVLGVFATLGLVLASIGVYGVMSYVVAQRTREVGVRLALGASPRNVLLALLCRGAMLIGVGAAIGLPFAVLLARPIFHELGQQPADPLPYMVSVGALAAAALLGTYIPARRASKVDPMVALRCE